jgi:hypothetical protein
LEKLGVDEADRATLFEHIEYFHYFSSAEGMCRFWYANSRLMTALLCSGVLVASMSWILKIFICVCAKQHSVLCITAGQLFRRGSNVHHLQHRHQKGFGCRAVCLVQWY